MVEVRPPDPGQGGEGLSGGYPQYSLPPSEASKVAKEWLLRHFVPPNDLEKMDQDIEGIGSGQGMYVRGNVRIGEYGQGMYVQDSLLKVASEKLDLVADSLNKNQLQAALSVVDGVLAAVNYVWSASLRGGGFGGGGGPDPPDNNPFYIAQHILDKVRKALAKIAEQIGAVGFAMGLGGSAGVYYELTFEASTSTSSDP